MAAPPEQWNKGEIRQTTMSKEFMATIKLLQQKGASLTEYALTVTLVAGLALAPALSLGNSANRNYGKAIIGLGGGTTGTVDQLLDADDPDLPGIDLPDENDEGEGCEGGGCGLRW